MKEWGIYGPITTAQPILVDSVNTAGEKFNEAKQLQTKLLQPIGWDSYRIQWTASKELPISAEQGSGIYLYRFNIDSEKYIKGKLNITTAAPFEVYVNDVKLSGRATIDTAGNVHPVKSSITIEPRTYSVVIKCLVSSKLPSNATLKVSIDGDDKKLEDTINLSTGTMRKLSIYDIMEGERPTGVSISPNGKYSVQTFSTTYPGGKSTSRRAEVREISTNRLLLSDSGEKVNLSFTPGSKLYYTKAVDKSYMLYVIDPTTMVETLIAENLPTAYAYWAPDESCLIVYVRDEQKDEKPALRRIVNPEDRQSGWRNRNFLYKYDIKSNELQPLTYGYSNTLLNDISNSGKYILFSTTKNRFTERPFRTSSMYMLNLHTMKVDTIWQDEKFINSAQFSPNGKQLLILASAEAFGGIGANVAEGQIPNSYDVQAYLMDIASRKVEPITKEFYPSIKSADWSVYDGNIYFSVVDQDRGNVYSYSPSSKKFGKLPLQTDVCTQFSIAKSSPAACYLGQTGSYPARTFKYDTKSQKSEVLADPLASRMTQLRLPVLKDWNFKSSDGTNITGRYYLPLDFDPSKKYPMIVYYYGGTTPVDRIFESRYSLHLYATMGYVVYLIQPSGSIGFGQEFAARHVNAWGKRTAEDIIEGTQKFMEEHPFVDKSKVGCIGASYGGFMTQYLQTQTDLFAAAISHAGISSIASYWGEGLWGYTYSSGASANSYPWNNPELYVEQSPLFNADKINTPILFLHGSVDTNVPIGESIQMFTALKLLGKTTEFIQVEGENHAIADYSKRIEWNNTIFAWFARFLKDEPQWWNALYPDKPGLE